MTRRDYELISSELKFVKPKKITDGPYADGRYDQWYITVSLMAGRLEGDNPNFNRDKFLKDCGVLPMI